IVPFEAINLSAVDLEIFKIYNNNILQFLQSNSLDGNYDLQRVGKVVFQKKIDLRSINPKVTPNGWNRYALDLSDFLQKDPQAIYQVRVGFRLGYADYYCGEEVLNGLDVPEPLNSGQTNEAGDYESIFDGYYGVYGYYGGYRYNHRDDPCYPAYYNEDQFARSNVLVSDLGMIAKSSSADEYSVVVSDLRSAQPVSGATIEFYDYQQQVMAKATTNSKGIASTKLPKKPFVIVSRKDDKVGYVKIKDGRSLSVSRFDVGGVAVQDGIKGYLYGERGVWRPGDSVFLHFVLDDQDKGLPANHPIRFTLLDARGTEVETRTTSNNTGQIYPLHFATSKDAPTGNWTAKVEVGGARFTKYLRVETVKPNRLKIDLDFGKDRLVNTGKPIQADLAVNWLHGAPGSNLKTIIELQLSPKATKFKNYGDFTFDDPARRFNSEPKVWFEQRVNAEGKVEISERITTNTSAPGVLRAQFKTRAFEKGGDFSTDSRSIDYYPYQRFAGLRIPARPTGEKRLDIGQKDKVQMVLLDSEGKAISGQDLNIGLYRVDWRWWWDEGNGYLADYNSSTHYNAQANGTIRTNAKGEAEWELSVERWGRYLVRVCDGDGHCTGDFFYAGYPWDEEGGFNRQEAAMLAFSSSKPAYEVGETIEIKVPATVDSRMLVSLENGNGVLQSFWENAESGENVIRIPATEEMTPNIYVHLALIQPHAQTKNDLPMRMYGVLPITVKNPKTELSPTIEMADVLEPEEAFTVKVKETSGQDMSYTIAIVDDGLLDLTRFKTPSPWNRFYAKEALGVKTYDIYDYILGAYGGNLERLLSIGGDAEGADKPKEESANRFKPVVLHAGPFTVKKGQTAEHTFTMPNYVGSVRTMVVAANQGAYGNAEKTTPVRKPLMVLSTLPRVLGPSEELVMPVNVFAMDDQVKTVKVEVKETTGRTQFTDGQSQTINFSKPGEQVIGFPLRVSRQEGIARFEIKATSGREVATQSIEIDIRNPNSFVTEVSDYQLSASGTQTLEIVPVGVPGSNKAIVEVSALPPLDLGRNLDYLLRYPYGCIEQTTSSGFPQVYLDRLLPLDEAQKASIKRNVQATVNRLKLFQTPEGHFTYWPGAGNYISHWANSYAGHFLLIAKDQGYEIPGNLLRNWERAQKRLAKAWDPRQNEAGFYSSRSNELSQAYRLYTLALAGKPELSAMNRLRESAKLSPIARWRLAAAYALAGQKEIASNLIKQLPKSVDPYQEFSGSYGSALRDKAMILETLLLLDKADESATLMKAMSEDLSSGRWHSTQTTAYCLQAIGQFAEKFPPGKELKFQFKADKDRAVDMGSKTPIVQIELEEDVKSVKL
ncbi:MAG: MG2 domain-containing protein, partial [Bacteroidota bacterium]